jgi:hypothetical protein
MLQCRRQGSVVQAAARGVAGVVNDADDRIVVQQRIQWRTTLLLIWSIGQEEDLLRGCEGEENEEGGE